MKIKSLAALAFALIASACSSGGSGDGAAMLAAMNAYTSANPICTNTLYMRNGRAIIGSPRDPVSAGTIAYSDHAGGDSSVTPAWEAPLARAGLLERIYVPNRIGFPREYHLALTSRVQPVNGEFCFGHAVAISIINSKAYNNNYSADFQSRFVYADWARDPAVQSAVWNEMLDAKTRAAAGTSFSAGLFNDPKTGWRVDSTDLYSGNGIAPPRVSPGPISGTR